MSQRGGKWYGLSTAVSKTRWTSSCGTTTSTHGSSISLGVMSANSVRISAFAWPPTFSRVPGPEGVVERVLVGVDEEVDRLVLGHAEQLRGLLDGLLADLQGALAERRVALVPVDADDVALTVCQSKRSSP